MFKKILIANRGEIALRVIRSCREMSISTVAVYSEADRLSLHVQQADEAYAIGPAPATESYLRGDIILEMARRAKAEAIHPGYGFLSENPSFAKACRDAAVTFIGPTPESMQLLGDKLEAKKIVATAGVPVIPGTTQPIEDERDLRQEAARIGYPLLIKAAAGGGGKGIHGVQRPQDLPAALGLAQGEAEAAFGDRRVFLERRLERPRHIEVQILADQHGNLVHLGERECSIQRRYQKLIEESPSPAVTAKLRERLGSAAIAVAKAAGYTNAGTIEFLLDHAGEFYFLEANTRLQVEHPVTEWLTGVDLVKEQIRIAAGDRLAFGQDDIAFRGAAVECRITAEDPEMGFLPFTGEVLDVIEPSGPGVRFDHMLYPGLQVSRHYDSLLGKLVCWGANRSEAIQRMRRALDELHIIGLKTTVPFHQWVMHSQAFQRGELHTAFVEEHWDNHKQASAPIELSQAAAIAAAILGFRKSHRSAVAAQSLSEQSSHWKLAGRTEALRTGGPRTQ